MTKGCLAFGSLHFFCSTQPKLMFQVEDVNCIVVDWRGGSDVIYTDAVSNIRIVGAELKYLMDLLERDYGYTPANIHIIGHSLGAHAAGEAGRRKRGIARITGLDPAGPYFHSTPPEVRLDPSDAEFVDVIHSNAGRLFFDFERRKIVLAPFEILSDLFIRILLPMSPGRLPNDGPLRRYVSWKNQERIPNVLFKHRVFSTICSLQEKDKCQSMHNTNHVGVYTYRPDWNQYIQKGLHDVQVYILRPRTRTEYNLANSSTLLKHG
ncbi:hypothetical protein Y1Q_0009556 [Alligator mississippiensis]|uniref:Lipase domain-containing protein n=1 Tax=Alligator mississippiensis TaxID=8496 RepID=A0A151NUI3_ALLMI|nr:hypothetical protein Y1Q_0009556 [Alligator mississippiensis]